MKALTVALLIALAAGTAAAESADPNDLVANASDNPPNWCRNGAFPAMAQDYRLGTVARSAAMLSDFKETCPSLDKAKCDVDKMVKAGTAVAVSKQRGDFSCVFDPSDQSAGWMSTKDVTIATAGTIKAADWVGTWSDGTNRIVIKRTTKGLKVSGNAQWLGNTLDNGEQVVHTGDLDFTANPEKDRLRLLVKDASDCAAELIHIGKYLVVRDNGNCGGANVRFDGVYGRR
jgi:hypothetical protein